MAASRISPSASSATAAIPPPAGEVSQLATSPNELAQWTILCAAMCMAVASIPYSLRCYVRVAIKKSWLWEDYCGVVAWGGLMAHSAIIIKLAATGGGVHAWNLTLRQLNTEAYWFNVGTVMYGVTICAAKVAILLFFRRVFSPARYKPFDVFLLSFVGLVLLFYLPTTLVKIFECTPRAKIWDTKLPGGCINVPALLNTSGMFNTLTDVIILVVPVKAVWQLNMPRQRKVAVVLVFCIGFVAPVVSTIGFVVRVQGGGPDTSYTGPKILLWANAEIACCVICFSLPELGALRPAALRSRKARRHGGGMGYGESCASGNGSATSRKRQLTSASAGMSMHSPIASPASTSFHYPLQNRCRRPPPLPEDIASGAYLEVVPTQPRTSIAGDATRATSTHPGPPPPPSAHLARPHNHSTTTLAPLTRSTATRTPAAAYEAYLHVCPGTHGCHGTSRRTSGSGDDGEEGDERQFAAWGYAGDREPHSRHAKQDSSLVAEEGIVKTVRIEWEEEEGKKKGGKR